MTAEQCLNHAWLHRKVPPAPTMEVTKDNLRQFVERWNEHPNSPYVFEMTNGHVRDIKPDSLPSLEGMSPSPCGSVVSCGSDNAFQNIDTTNNNVLMPPSLDHLRRSSDSTCVVKGSDISERINLAEEIRKLSQKLFQLSTMSTIAPPQSNNDPIIPTPLEIPKIETPKNGYIKGPYNCVLPKDHPLNVNCGIPWRRTKFRISNMSRDVPISPKNIDNARMFRFSTSSIRPNQDEVGNSPNGTKDLLLKLLEHWDGPQGPSRPNPRHGSFSTEWTENDSLGQKTISSLNTFFQSRAAAKKVTQFHKS